MNKPLSWIPTLYLGESLPFAAVMLMSLVLYQEMGLTDTQITLYTGWLGLPWVIKPLWSPIVDGIKTKRWWILAMQLLIGAALALLAFTLPTAFWLQCSLALFMLIAFSSATHDICADGFYILALDNKDQELYVGLRNTFYRIGMVLGQGGLVMLAGLLQKSEMSIQLSWSITFLAVSGLMLMLAAYHQKALPKPEGNEELGTRTSTSASQMQDADDTPTSQMRTGSPRSQVAAASISVSSILEDFKATFRVFFTKPHLLTALLFILLFRLPEGLLTKIVPLFLKRTIEEGGLALSDVQYGFVYGTLGVIGLLGGGIVGGWLVSKFGLKKMLWPLVLCITLPDIVYVWLSFTQTQSLPLIATCVFIEQVGYGLGFTAYTLYLVSFSHGERSTSVFSFCTSFQYLGGVMLPGMVSGWLSDQIGGYQPFFIAVMGFCLVTFAVTALLHLPEENDSMKQ
ncbi:MAG: MFS transporter [Bacteroidaceae bacterium]|nr:MFS transporter [Bacteroidaceae bacterium]